MLTRFDLFSNFSLPMSSSHEKFDSWPLSIGPPIRCATILRRPNGRFVCNSHTPESSRVESCGTLESESSLGSPVKTSSQVVLQVNMQWTFVDAQDALEPCSISGLYTQVTGHNYIVSCSLQNAKVITRGMTFTSPMSA